MRKMSPEEFLKRVEKTDYCWIWKNCKDRDGYGQVGFNYRLWKAHRLSFFFFKDGYKNDLVVCHSCDNPSCVNPEHLWQGTIGDNNRDTVSKGRYQNRHSKQTHCKRGHPFVGENLYIDPTGKRVCKICRRSHDKARYRKSRLTI